MENLTLSEWNDETLLSMILVVLAVYLLVGTCGNVLVLLVYACQMKNSSDERFFIPILAACDLIATLYLGSLAIYNSIFIVSNSNSVLCKTTSFFTGLSIFMSICVLLIIALQRYFKICMNLNHSKTRFFKRASLVFASLFSILASSPLPFFMEIVPFHSNRYGVTGVRCETSPKGNTLARNIYFILVGVFAVATGTTVNTLYSNITYKMFKRSNNQNDEKINEINVEVHFT